MNIFFWNLEGKVPQEPLNFLNSSGFSGFLLFWAKVIRKRLYPRGKCKTLSVCSSICIFVADKINILQVEYWRVKTDQKILGDIQIQIPICEAKNKSFFPIFSYMSNVKTKILFWLQNVSTKALLMAQYKIVSDTANYWWTINFVD